MWAKKHIIHLHPTAEADIANPADGAVYSISYAPRMVARSTRPIHTWVQRVAELGSLQDLLLRKKSDPECAQREFKGKAQRFTGARKSAREPGALMPRASIGRSLIEMHNEHDAGRR